MVIVEFTHRGLPTLHMGEVKMFPWVYKPTRVGLKWMNRKFIISKLYAVHQFIIGNLCNIRQLE